MNASSPARIAYGQRAPRDKRADVAPIRAYRRDRQHLFPLEDYQAAVATGGTVWSYCGIRELVGQGDPDSVTEVVGAEPEDCVTCVDIWRGRGRVRL